MASNPIKRRARQSFFIGFLVALIIMAAVVMFLVTRLKSLSDENAKLKIPGDKISVYTITKDVEAGEVVTAEDLEASTMQLSRSSQKISVEEYISPDIFYGEDELTGEEYQVSYKAKINIPAGTVVTLPMLQDQGIANDERLMEYNMIVLPSQLKNGDYIDIRFRLPSGKEDIVLAKKKVEQCTVTSIWMKMDENDILTMNSAIVDACTVAGSQLRATVYTDPLMQEASSVTYPTNMDVLDNILKNPNILDNAKKVLVDRWGVISENGSDQTDLEAERTLIDSYANSMETSDKIDAVSEAYSKEATDINTARGEFVSSLDGTGLVGTVE